MKAHPKEPHQFLSVNLVPIKQPVRQAAPKWVERLLKEADPSSAAMTEFDAVSRMLTLAGRAGMMVEVVHAFGNYRKSGDDIKSATICALYDWDL